MSMLPKFSPVTVTLPMPDEATFAVSVCEITGESYEKEMACVPTKLCTIVFTERVSPVPADVRHSIVVTEFHDVVAHEVSPSRTVLVKSEAAKLFPLRVTEMPPLVAAFHKFTRVITAASNVNALKPVPEWPSMTTSRGKSNPPYAGDRQVTEVAVLHEAVGQTTSAISAVTVKSIEAKFRPVTVTQIGRAHV